MKASVKVPVIDKTASLRKTLESQVLMMSSGRVLQAANGRVAILGAEAVA
jgi:hypothetical protein